MPDLQFRVLLGPTSLRRATLSPKNLLSRLITLLDNIRMLCLLAVIIRKTLTLTPISGFGTISNLQKDIERLLKKSLMENFIFLCSIYIAFA